MVMRTAGRGGCFSTQFSSDNILRKHSLLFCYLFYAIAPLKSAVLREALVFSHGGNVPEGHYYHNYCNHHYHH